MLEENQSEVGRMFSDSYELGAVVAFQIDSKTDRIILCLATKDV
jgi:hypothetical protein